MKFIILSKAIVVGVNEIIFMNFPLVKNELESKHSHTVDADVAFHLNDSLQTVDITMDFCTHTASSRLSKWFYR